MAENERDRNSVAPLAKKLDAGGWGVFFIWMGIAFLLDLGWGIGILGVGLIALGGQAARRYFGLPVERFWLVVGMVLVLWGAWELLGIRLGEATRPVNVLPIVFIAIGVALVVAALRRKP